MIVPSPVTTLKSGRVTDPVDIITVLASATTSLFCGVTSSFFVSPSDPDNTDPESVDHEDSNPDSTPIGRIEPLSITPVETSPEEVESGTITTQVFVTSHELFATTQVDTSEKIADSIILTETSGIIISPVIVVVSIFLSSTPVRIDHVSTSTDPVSPIVVPVSTSTGVEISVFSVITVSMVSMDSISFCGKKISSDIHSSVVLVKRSRFSHPRILTIGSS